jgi:hypothetical protein
MKVSGQFHASSNLLPRKYHLINLEMAPKPISSLLYVGSEGPTPAIDNREIILVFFRFDPEDGGSIFLRNDSELLPDYMESHPRRMYSSEKYIHTETNLNYPVVKPVRYSLYC